jgi:isopenicillin-N epimerase
MRTDLGWQLRPDIVFLNHGSYGACPTAVLDVQRDWRDRLEAEPIRFLTRELIDRLGEARTHVGAFLHADPEGIAFLPNATAGVNTVLRSLRFVPGDELLTADHEYNAVINAMRFVARRDGADVTVAPIPYPIASEDQVVDALVGAVTPRTRLLVISHVTSPTALVLPVERLVREFAARGIDTLVDAAHAPGMVPLDVDALGAAYWTGNGHKWPCAPKGAGVLWVREDRRGVIHPMSISHGANAPLSDGRTRFRHEFDWTGTADPTAYLTLPAAIDWMAAQVPGGWPEVMATNRSLALAGRDTICAALGIDVPAPPSLIGSMATIPLPRVASDAAAATLAQRLYDAHGIEVPIIGWPVPAARSSADTAPAHALLRISAQRYNELADYERLAGALTS